MASFADRHYRNAPALTDRASSASYRKQAAPTPPPLLSAAARGRQQTLGPVFNEEEDGDDSEYIEARMRELELGYGPSQADLIAMANMQQLRYQQQALQLQQQYLLQQLLSTQPINRGQPGSRDAQAMQLQQLQMQMQQVQMQAQAQQYGVDPRVQAQLLAQLQASASTTARKSARQQHAEAQAHAFTVAQVQQKAQERAYAQVLAREQRKHEAMEQDLRARFESRANPEVIRASKPTTSPVTRSRPASIGSDPGESPIKFTAPLGRFAQARQAAGTPFGELTALLARRSAEKGESATPTSMPVTPATPADPTAPEATSKAAALPADSHDRLAARTALKSLGNGRPFASTAGTEGKDRIKSSPLPRLTSKAVEPAPIRAVSLGQPLKPIRQPFGPPAPVNELGERNFQSMARKAAGKGLGMLGRRGDGSGSESTSPLV